MQVQLSPESLIAAKDATPTATKLFHAFLIVAWVVVGSMTVYGQEFAAPIQFDDPRMAPGEWIQGPVVNGPFDGTIVGNEGIQSIPHRILKSPSMNPLRSEESSSHYTTGDYGSASGQPPSSGHSHAASSAKQILDETIHTDGPLLRRLHEHKQPAPATIPDAAVEPRWKTPYAYGYFGASGTKHWTRSNGYRDTYKRWTKQ